MRGYTVVLDLCDSEQFYLEDECRATGYAGLREFAISHFGRDVNLPFVTDAHLLHCDNPTLYQFVQTERYWCSATTTVELLSVYSPPRVVCGDDTAGRRMSAVVLSLIDDLVIDSFRERLHSIFFGFRLQPFLIDWPVCILFCSFYFGFSNLYMIWGISLPR